MPLKLKSSESRSSMVRGKLQARGSPPSAAFWIRGPPGKPRLRMLATLSKASPAASSIVAPSTLMSSGLRTSSSEVCPPLTTRATAGQGSGSSGGRAIAALHAWAWMWFTPTSGLSQARASVLAVVTPISRQPTSPGRWATAIRSMSPRSAPARARASRRQASMFSMWAREASSGTTPP